MGSTTYEWIHANQIRPNSEKPGKWPYTQPTWVFSSRELRRIDGADLRFVRGDVGPVHRQMVAAAGDKNIWLVGGGELVGRFYDQGLLDELFVQVTSVTLGRGAPLLPRRIARPPLRLLSATQWGDAFVQLRYEVPAR
jgi:dihydrofolate reductase